MTVTASALWCSSVVPPSTHAMSEANSVQLALVTKIIGSKRKADEGWVEYRTRTFRDARATLQIHGIERWSTKWLKRRWNYMGHISRAACPPPSSLLVNFRRLSWWRDQQARQQGTRHNNRFYPAINREEQRLNQASGKPD